MELRKDFQEMATALAAGRARAEATELTAIKGFSFEDVLEAGLASIAAVHGDLVENVSTRTGVSGTKKGDHLVTLCEEDTFRQEARFVIECKDLAPGMPATLIVVALCVALFVRNVAPSLLRPAGAWRRSWPAERRPGRSVATSGSAGGCPLRSGSAGSCTSSATCSPPAASRFSGRIVVASPGRSSPGPARRAKRSSELRFSSRSSCSGCRRCPASCAGSGGERGATRSGSWRPLGRLGWSPGPSVPRS